MISSYPFIVTALIFTWIVILSGSFIFFSIRYFLFKKYVPFALLIVATILLVFVAQVMTAFIKGGSDGLSTWFANLNLLVYVITLSILTLFVPLMIVHLYKYSRAHISSNSIIKGFDASNEGFLYFDEDGACLLINKKMEEIASLLTKNYVLNGHDFLKLVQDKTITLSNGMTYKFINKEITIDEYPFFNKNSVQTITELIALDVTELVKKNDLLLEDNKRLQEMNEALTLYNENTLEVIRHKEILSAKIKIHNEMNALVLQSSYYLSNNDKKGREQLLSKWENNTLLLCKEAESDDNSDFINDINTLADAIGVIVECNDYSLIQGNEKITSLFIATTKESLLNVAKHTKSKKLKIVISKENDMLTMSFINDNNTNTKPIIKGGGFTNIEKHVEELHGKMTIINEEQFILRIEVKDAI